MALTVEQATARVALLRGPQAEVAQAALAQYRETGNADVFTRTIEGLGSRFTGNMAASLSGAVAIFSDRFTAEQLALETAVVQAANRDGERGEKVMGITAPLTPFV